MAIRPERAAPRAAWLIWPALAVLLGLGTWQLQRLEWKTGLIATIEARRAAPAAPLPAALDADRRMAWEFTRVALSGRFRHDGEMSVLAQTRNGRAGRRIVAPFEVDGGGAVLVDRGWAPDGGAVERPAGPVALEGLLRGPPAGNPFRPDDRPGDGVWYRVDPAAMARAAGLPPRGFYVQAAGAAAPGRYPVPGGPALALRNDHLGYALTWYGLAAALAAVAVAFRRRRARGAAA